MERIFYIASGLNSKKTQKMMNDFEKNKKIELDEEILKELKSTIFSASVNEEETILIMRDFYKKIDYILDPRKNFFLNN